MLLGCMISVRFLTEGLVMRIKAFEVKLGDNSYRTIIFLHQFLICSTVSLKRIIR